MWIKIYSLNLFVVLFLQGSLLAAEKKKKKRGLRRFSLLIISDEIRE